MERHLQAPISKEELKTLKSGDYVYITGTIYTARDAAHKRMYETLQNQENLPIDIQYLLYGTVSGKGRTSYRFCRSDNGQPHG